jgi:hypothetical protein
VPDEDRVYTHTVGRFPYRSQANSSSINTVRSDRWVLPEKLKKNSYFTRSLTKSSSQQGKALGYSGFVVFVSLKFE